MTKKDKGNNKGLKRPASAAKAKAKNQAKAKLSPKKTKGKPKDKVEKKDKEEKKDKDSNKGMKRPASSSKPSGLRQQLDKLGEGIEEKEKEEGEQPEEEQPEEDQEVDPDQPSEKRNRLKSGKFRRMLKAGTVPDQIKQVWNNCGTRSQETQLLNRLFKKDVGSGQWVMKAESPEFQSFLKTSDKNYGTEAQKTYPRAIMLHHFFHGDQGAFDSALRDGDIYELQNAGKISYAFDCAEQGRTKSKDNAMTLSRGQIKVTSKEHEQLEDVLEKYDFSVIGCSSIGSGSGPHEKESLPLAVKDAERNVKWSLIEKHLVEAKAAQDRLLKDSQKILPAIQKSRDVELVGKFKDMHGQLQQGCSKVSEALLWKDLLTCCCKISKNNLTTFPHMVFARNFKESVGLQKVKWIDG